MTIPLLSSSTMLWIGAFLGYATGDTKRKAEDTNTPERPPERQQDSSLTWDRAVPFPQHPKKF